MSEHTPLPWSIHASPYTVFDRWGRIQAHVEIKDRDRNEAKANAEFIVRACNSYYDLLAACEAALGRYVDHLSACAYPRGGDCDCGAHQLEAAILRARGTEGRGWPRSLGVEPTNTSPTGEVAS